MVYDLWRGYQTTVVNSTEPGTSLNQVVVDPTTRYSHNRSYIIGASISIYRTLYWSDVGSSPKINKASMDGSGERTIIDDLNYTFVFTLDHSQQVLYWMDSSTTCNYNTNYTLESSNVNGFGRSTHSLGSCCRHYYCHSQAIDFFGGAVYSYSGYFGDIFQTVVNDTPIIYRYDGYYMCSSSHTGMKVISHQQQVQGMYAHMTDSL